MMEFSQPRTLTAEYRITTPMFLGGEDQSVDHTHFRNASFKGALRFWWRALNWGRVLKAAGGDTAQALTNLHREEGRLFGLASDGKNSSQSLVQLRSWLDAKIVEHAQDGERLRGLAYLLGLGLWSNSTNGPAAHKGIQRDYLQAGGSLQVELGFLSGASEEQIAQTRQAAIALGMFGGLGSRARKGFGSLAIQSVIDDRGGKTEIAGVSDISAFFEGLDFSAPESAPLSAFNTRTRIDVSERGRDSHQVLLKLCKELHAYRDGTVETSERRSNFAKDRELALRAYQGETIDSLPGRASFGLPHNYQWIGSESSKLQISPKNTERNRRASPLFIHIHEFPDRKIIAVQTLLASTFLPEGTEIQLKSSSGRSAPDISFQTVDYRVIERYLDGFKGRENLRVPNRG